MTLKFIAGEQKVNIVAAGHKLLLDGIKFMLKIADPVLQGDGGGAEEGFLNMELLQRVNGKLPVKIILPLGDQPAADHQVDFFRGASPPDGDQ